MSGRYKVFVGGYYKGSTDDLDKIREIEQRAVWNGKSFGQSGNNYYVNRRRRF